MFDRYRENDQPSLVESTSLAPDGGYWPYDDPPRATGLLLAVPWRRPTSDVFYLYLGAVRDDWIEEGERFPREPTDSRPCPVHPRLGIQFWEDGYDERHCCLCSWPPTTALVRRAWVLVPQRLPSHYLSPAEPGEVLDWVERPDLLVQWRRLERGRSQAREAQRDAAESEF